MFFSETNKVKTIVSKEFYIKKEDEIIANAKVANLSGKELGKCCVQIISNVLDLLLLVEQFVCENRGIIVKEKSVL